MLFLALFLMRMTAMIPPSAIHCITSIVLIVVAPASAELLAVPDACREGQTGRFGYCFSHIPAVQALVGDLRLQYADYDRLTTDPLLRPHTALTPVSGLPPQLLSSWSSLHGMRFLSPFATNFAFQYRIAFDPAKDDDPLLPALPATVMLGLSADNFFASVSNGTRENGFGSDEWAEEALLIAGMDLKACGGITRTLLGGPGAQNRDWNPVACTALKMCREQRAELGMGSVMNVKAHMVMVLLPLIATDTDEYTTDDGEPDQSILCVPPVTASGLLSSSRAFVLAPIYRIAAMVDVNLSTIMEDHGMEDGGAAPQGVRCDADWLHDASVLTPWGGGRRVGNGDRTKGVWRGSPTATQFLPGECVYVEVTGDPLAPSVSPPPTRQGVLLRAEIDTSTEVPGFSQPASNEPRGEYIISSTTSLATHCAIVHDPAAFALSTIAANASGPSPPSHIDAPHLRPYRCAAFRTVDELQLACLQDSECVGFTTTVSRLGTEIPLCLHTESQKRPPFDRFYYPRVFYAKQDPLTHTCLVQTALSGTMAISLQLTTFGDDGTNAIVMVDGTIAAFCGANAPFAGGGRGSSGNCYSYALCAVVPVRANSVVTVAITSTSGVAFHLCDAALGVLFEQTTIDAVQVPRVELPDPPALAEADTLTESVSFEVSKSDPMALLYVHRAERAALLVAQSMFDCSLFPAKSCPSHQLSLGTAPASLGVLPHAPTSPLQVCGGQTNFFANFAGRSDQCHIQAWCAQSTALPSASFSGFINISAGALAARTTLCPTAFGELRIRKASSEALVTFPFAEAAYASGFLVAVPYSPSSAGLLSATRLVLSAQVPASAAEPLTGLQVGSLNNPLGLVYVDKEAMMGTSPTAAAPTPESIALRLNSTLTRQACVVDHTTSPLACAFVVPRGATYVRLDVAQVAFEDTDSDITVTITTAARSEKIRCGIEAGFTRFPAASGRCDLYHPCVDRFLFINDTLATKYYAASPDNIVTISVTSENVPASNGCPLAASIIATFSTPPITAIMPAAASCAASEYECPFQRHCIPRTKICDNVIDCNDQSDERLCDQWYALDANETVSAAVPLEVVMRASTSGGSSIVANMTLSECTNAAIERSQQLSTQLTYVVVLDHFRYNPLTRRCKLLPAHESSLDVLVADYLDLPSEIITTNTTANGFEHGDVTYVYLETPADFKRCETTVACSGNGKLVLSIDEDTGAPFKRDGETCQCTCGGDYAGADCSGLQKLSYLGDLVVVFAGLDTSDHIYTSVVEDALTLPLSSVRCATDVQQIDTTHIGMQCTVKAKRGGLDASERLRSTLLAPAQWPGVNEIFEENLHPTLAYITAMGFVNPYATVKCATTKNANASCPVVHGAVSTVQVTLTGSEVATAIALDIESGSVNRRQRHRRTVSCTPLPLAATGSCQVTVCEITATSILGGLGLGGHSLVSPAIGVTNVTYNTRSPFAQPSKCKRAAMTVEVRGRTGDAPVDTAQALVDENIDYSPLLIAAAAVFTGAFVLMVGFGLVLLIAGHRRLQAAFVAFRASDTKKTADHFTDFAMSSAASLLRAKLRELVRHRFLSSPASRPIHVGTCLVVFSSVLLVVASFIMITYATSEGRRSNYSILYEEYADQHCEASAAAFLPRRAFTVAADSTECSRMSVVGEAAGTVFAEGRCVNGGRDVELQSGTSNAGCRGAKRLTIAAGACLQVQQTAPQLAQGRSVYVRLICTDTATAMRRQETLDRLTIRAATQTTVPVTAPTVPTVSSNSMPFKASSAVYRYDPPKPFVAAAMAGPEEFDGDANPLRLVFQQSPETASRVTVSAPAPALAAESANKPFMGRLPKSVLGAMAPTASGYPIGFLFRSFGTSATVEEATANAGAFRYYGVKGTPMDIGSVLSTGKALKDGDGFTISLYLRATRTTSGFAFAVTDAFEDPLGNIVYPLDRLAELIENGAGQAAWYNSTHHVYASLYVNGPGQALTFAHAVPRMDPVGGGGSTSGTQNEVEMLVWDLASLNMEHVFNGLWHHIAIVFRVENDKPKALLMVDGFTSYSSEGWQQCVNALPPPIAGHPIGQPVPVHASTDTFAAGGLLTVGYLNGGVYRLEFDPAEQPSTFFYVEGTNHMRGVNAIPKDTLRALAGVLFVCSILAALRILASLRGLIVSGSKAAKIGRYNHCRTFYELQGGDSQTGVGAEQYLPVRCWTARRWGKGQAGKTSGMSLSELAAICGELEAQFSDPMRHLRALLFQARKGLCVKGPIQYFPAPDEWNALVDEDCASEKQRLQQPLGVLGHLRKWGGGRRHLSDREAELLVDSMAVDMLVRSLPPATSLAAMPLIDPLFSRHSAKLTRDVARGAGKAIEEMEEMEADNLDVKEGMNDGLGHAQDHLSGEKIQQMIGMSGGSGVDVGAAERMQSLKASVAELVAPIVVVIQSVYVWMSSVGFPGGYRAAFLQTFSFLSVDFSAALHGVPPIVTPLLQLFAGVAAMCALVYLLLCDNRLFDGSVIRYVIRRDAVDRSDPAANKAAAAAQLDRKGGIKGKDGQPHTTSNKNDADLSDGSEDEEEALLHDPRIPSVLYDALRSEVPEAARLMTTPLPVPSCRRADLFLGNASMTEGERHDRAAPKDWAAEHTLRLTTTDDQTVTVRRAGPSGGGCCCCGPPPSLELLSIDTADGERQTPEPPTASGRMPPSGAVNAPPAPPPAVLLQQITVFCARHPHTRLVPQTQSKLWPFDNRPRCSMRLPSGEVCNEDTDVIYVCGKHDRNELGDLCECTYAVCLRHCRPTIPQAILLATVLKFWRKMKLNGVVWCLCFVALMIANAVYTPFLKTAMMIIICHPTYQCEFTRCWSDPDQRFLLAVFLSIVVLVVLGVGFPLMLLVFIQRRRAIMATFFAHAQYGGAYLTGTEDGDDDDDEQAPTTTDRPPFDGIVADFGPGAQGGQPSPRRKSSVAVDRLRQWARQRSAQQVSLAEWTRFVSTDTSALAQLYDAVHYRWLFLPPVLLVLKIGLLMPAVLIEARSVNQRIGIAVAEILYAAFMFATETHMSPIVVFSFRFASMHQLLVLGLSNLGVVRQYEENEDYSVAMVISTACFLLVNIGLLVATVLYPTIQPFVEELWVERRLNAHGYVFTGTVSIFVDPTAPADPPPATSSQPLLTVPALPKQDPPLPPTTREDDDSKHHHHRLPSELPPPPGTYPATAAAEDDDDDDDPLLTTGLRSHFKAFTDETEAALDRAQGRASDGDSDVVSDVDGAFSPREGTTTTTTPGQGESVKSDDSDIDDIDL